MAEQEVGVALETVEERRAPAVRDGGVSTSDLVQLAQSDKLNVDMLERLIALQERATERNARDAFNEALSAFQEECPQIGRTAKAKFANRAGTNHEYNYAPLDEVARVIRPILKRHGLSYTWDMEVQQAGFLKVTTTVRHVEGHFQSSSFVVPTETNAAMSAQQKYGAATTYAQRRSLTAALGITTADEDTDGAGVDPDPITPEQEATINALGREVNMNADKFLDMFGVDRVADIPAGRYQEAVSFLEQKRGRK